MNLSPERLAEVTKVILKGMGESEDNTQVCARILVSADMRGLNTHGVNLLRMAYNRVKAGMLNLPTRTTVVEDRNGTAILDGNDGLGQVSALRCSELGMEKAKQHGISLVLLRRTNNIGALGYYTSHAAQKGFIQMVMTNGNPSMAPYGAAEPYFGTNPISIGVPCGKGRPVFLDMSSSVVARGKIRMASLKGETIPLGWALDEKGEPTIDPKKALKGCMLPLGGPKGSGLAMMVDILAGVLSGSQYARKIKSFHTLEGPTGVGASFLTIDPSWFLPAGRFEELVGEYVREMKSLKKLEGVNEILAPGEWELKQEERSLREGVEVPDEVTEELDRIAAELRCSVAFNG